MSPGQMTIWSGAQAQQVGNVSQHVHDELVAKLRDANPHGVITLTLAEGGTLTILLGHITAITYKP